MGFTDDERHHRPRRQPNRFDPMSRQHHELKTETAFYQKVEVKKKRFEVRKDDRNFQVGDMVTLLESVNGTLTGRKYGPIEIDYILRGPAYGVEAGHCVFSWFPFQTYDHTP